MHQVSSLLFFLAPLLMLVYLYTMMGLTIHKPSCLRTNLTAIDTVCCTRRRNIPHLLGDTDSQTQEDRDSFQGPRLQSNKTSILILLGKCYQKLTSIQLCVGSFSAAVVVAFFICWAPFHAQRLIYVYFKHTKFFRTVNEYLFHVSGFFYYLNCTLNPILYNVMSLKYR